MATPVKFRQVKIILAGDKDTGKHCFARRLVDNRYPRDRWTNNDCDTYDIKMKVDEYSEIPVQIFVVRGASRGKTALKKIYKNIDGYMVMFDVTNPESYDNIMGWKKDIDAALPSNRSPPCIVLANKIDLEKENDVGKQLDGIEGYCESLNFCGHFETSCKNGTGIQESMAHLLGKIVDQVIVEPNRSRQSSTTSPPGTPEPSDEGVPPPPPPLQNQEHVVKIVVIGDIATGKTAIIQRYVKKTHNANYLPTIGVDIAQRKFQHGNHIINLHIWEVAGTERVGTVTHLFYRGAAGCLIVFDQSKIATLRGAAKWKEDFDAKVNFDEASPVPCILVGNKCDLPKDDRIQEDDYMTNFSQTHRFLRWFQTSAKDNTNITETFTFLIHEILGKITEIIPPGKKPHGLVTIRDDSVRVSKNNSCCGT